VNDDGENHRFAFDLFNWCAGKWNLPSWSSVKGAVKVSAPVRANAE